MTKPETGEAPGYAVTPSKIEPVESTAGMDVGIVKTDLDVTAWQEQDKKREKESLTGGVTNRLLYEPIMRPKDKHQEQAKTQTFEGINHIKYQE